jgi:kynurenine formamidase
MGKMVYVDLTHPIGAEIPRWPYFDKPVIDSKHSMAKGGVLTQYIGCTMHTGTHCDAPRHVMEVEFDGKRARYTHEMPIDAYTGEAVALDIQIERWGLITGKHLDDACRRMGIDPDPAKGELENKVVCLVTGMNMLFDDTKEYYHYSCGTGVEAGQWFVDHKVKCVAMDMQALDHPLHTAMGNNGMTRMNLLGATGKPITEEYKELFGEEAYAKFDKFEYIRIYGQEAYDELYGDLENIGIWGTWEPCHKEMLGHGIVGVENLGGDLDKIPAGTWFDFFCFPLRWYLGDGSMARCVALIDEDKIDKSVPDREYKYGGTGFESEDHSGLEYMQKLFARNK